MSRLASIIRVMRLRRKGRWVGLHWLWNKLWAWQWKDAEYATWLENEKKEADALFKALEMESA